MTELQKYIKEKKGVLNQLYIGKYCTEEDIQRLCKCENEIQVDIVANSLIDKYYDIMLANFDKTPDIDVHKSILNSDLYLNAKNALLRAKFDTFDDFWEYVKDCGWSNIKRFGAVNARMTFKYLMPDKSADEIEEILNNYKRPHNVDKEEN